MRLSYHFPYPTDMTIIWLSASGLGADKPLLPLDNKSSEHEEKDKAKPVTYSYSFFHIIFSLASMYSAMLLTGWSTSVGESGKLVDVGWPSVWVRILTGWAAAGLYIWSLAAPILFPDREFWVSSSPWWYIYIMLQNDVYIMQLLTCFSQRIPNIVPLMICKRDFYMWQTFGYWNQVPSVSTCPPSIVKTCFCSSECYKGRK